MSLSLSIAAISAAVSLALAPQQGAAEVGAVDPEGRCGFYLTPGWNPEGTTARYKHCAGSFILIKIVWSGGNSYNSCVAPWENYPFWESQGQQVTNAYYIPTPPWVANIDGKLYCMAGAPQD